MEIAIHSLDSTQKGMATLPVQFSEPVSPSLIARAVLTIQQNNRQPFGSSPTAGTRVSAQVSRRRRKYRGSYGKGISRVPRKILTRRGMQMAWQGALAPGTVKGRRAHPPKAYQIWERKINKKENSKAIRSALSATLVREFVEGRGHTLPKAFPFIVDDTLASIKKTSEVQAALAKLGFDAELKRTEKRSIRAGKGKMRGRKYKTKVGPLIVVADACALQKAASNLPGIEVALVDKLNAEQLAPGAVPGRLTIYTKAAIEKMKKENLFA